MADHLPDDPRHAAAGPRARGAAAAAGCARAGSGPARRPHPAATGLRSALWLPPFGDLADPVVVARLAAEAEEAGWHGFFVWDHLCWRAPVRPVADPWIILAAIATATERLRLGPMVTPLARRRPAKVARETVTLDWLSGGRLTLGAGLGSDRFGGELSATGEQLDDRRRGQAVRSSSLSATPGTSGRLPIPCEKRVVELSRRPMPGSGSSNSAARRRRRGAATPVSRRSTSGGN